MTICFRMRILLHKIIVLKFKLYLCEVNFVFLEYEMLVADCCDTLIFFTLSLDTKIGISSFTPCECQGQYMSNAAMVLQNCCI